MYRSCGYEWHGLPLVILLTFVSLSSNVLAADYVLPNRTVTCFIPFSNAATNSNLKYVPELNFTIGNYTSSAPMDTGSTGILLPAKRVPGFCPTNCTHGSEYLSSSKRLYEGCWIDSMINISSIAVAKVPVLAVSSLCTCTKFCSKKGKCAVKTSNCTQNPKVQYLGVGFGRDHLDQPQGHPDKNPLLNIVSINGSDFQPDTMHTGYIITAAGIHLGLTATNAASFTTTKLAPGPYHCHDQRDWASVPSCISIDNATCVPGTSLFDTGINSSYLRTTTTLHNTHCICDGIALAPGLRCPKSCTQQLLPNHTVHMLIGSAPNYTAYYNLVGGETENPMTPSEVLAQPPQEENGSYMNTGRGFYRGFEVLFDAETGVFGLRSRLPHGSTYGGVCPAGGWRGEDARGGRMEGQIAVLDSW
ncbi:hypothetical protein MMC11_000806 [Xylographa trunciseda]|nr:hypothetical protein [Xylographa trunciseda]